MPGSTNIPGCRKEQENAALYAGAKFVGSQVSKDSTYEVEVTLKNVNLADSMLCGDLLIRGLTEQFQELVTYFDAEIIGEKHSFYTGNYDAKPKDDLEHWKKFPEFTTVQEKIDLPGFAYDASLSDAIFMRWKEKFMVADHTVDSIKGASFAGFYYICFCPATKKIDGYYFSTQSEKFQKLSLTLVEQSKFPSTHFF
eukprot:m.22153 g.22153  ORF g.22153 m.22153 type:complete len:197 (-) comp7356_c0_seq2:164-754(-)